MFMKILTTSRWAKKNRRKVGPSRRLSKRNYYIRLGNTFAGLEIL